MGRFAAGVGAFTLVGGVSRRSVGEVPRVVADDGAPDGVDDPAAAFEPAERQRLSGPVPFPFADFEPGDLICLNNFGTCRRNHQGVDIGEARVLPVPATLVACADGVVTQRAWSSRPGNFVVLRGDDERWYRYHHLDEFDEAIEVGERVVQGQRLGTMGSTGNTSWPHLHFEVWIGDGAYAAAGTVLDPVPLLAVPGSVQLNPRECG